MKLHRSFFHALAPATLALASAALWQPSTAKAVAYTFSGSLTTTDPTFNRPVTTTQLSSVGTSVYYDVQAFTVTLSGNCTLSIDAATLAPGTSDDSFLCLYQNSFNPASPLTNLVAIDDDSGTGDLSLLTSNLTAGVSYFMITTTYANGATGTYSDSITPANTAAVVVPTAVPEPGSLTLLGLGMAGALGWTRRRVRRG